MIKTPKESPFLGIPYPDDGCDPFYDQYETQTLAAELVMFYSKMIANSFLGGGGTKSWSPSDGMFSWTTDFSFVVPHYGKKIAIAFGPDGTNRAVGIADGQAVTISIPAILNANATQNLVLLSQLDPTVHNQVVVAMRIGSSLFLRNIGEMT